MNLSIFDLRNIAPESIWLEITSADLLRVQQEIDRSHHSNQTAKYHARLNRLSLYALQSWLESQGYDFTPEFFPSAEGLSWIWEIVTGTAFNIGANRIVTIPNDFKDTEELIVPREWLDIPSWAGNYYLAVQVDEDNERICVWGYISYNEIKNVGKYDDIYRNYYIDREYLHSDFELLWMDCLINTSVVLQRESLPQIDKVNAQKLIRKVMVPTIFSPRLLLDFSDLATILNSPEYLKEIHRKRISTLTKLTEIIQDKVDASKTNIDSAWLKFKQFQLEIGFDLPNFFTPKLEGCMNEISNDEQIALKNQVNYLYSNQKPDKKIDLPTKIESPEDLLLYLMQHTTDETLRWKAAEYLWEIEGDTNKYCYRRIKHLGLVLPCHKLGLMVAMIPLLNERYAVLYRVYSIGDEKFLPCDLKLTLFSEDNEQLFQVSSQSMDESIQFYFTAAVGDLFTICVSMHSISVTEAFEI